MLFIQVYWWDGKDNAGRYTDPGKSPYLVALKLTYRESQGEKRACAHGTVNLDID